MINWDLDNPLLNSYSNSILNQTKGQCTAGKAIILPKGSNKYFYTFKIIPEDKAQKNLENSTGEKISKIKRIWMQLNYCTTLKMLLMLLKFRYDLHSTYLKRRRPRTKISKARTRRQKNKIKSRMDPKSFLNKVKAYLKKRIICMKKITHLYLRS